jgi:Holliday junction DNA helicase RuvA
MRDSVKKLAMPSADSDASPSFSAPASPQSEAFGALLALGYKPPEITRLLKAADEPGLTTTELIRRALQAAGKG